MAIRSLLLVSIFCSCILSVLSSDLDQDIRSIKLSLGVNSEDTLKSSAY